ncbi:MAG: hypothetical protein JSU92_10495 [Deltaproteobacteria bacterium]|nr:MAG: hypothetical protein JSU92_10495 [Deltaproteobacteria bacterium]
MKRMKYCLCLMLFLFLISVGSSAVGKPLAMDTEVEETGPPEGKVLVPEGTQIAAQEEFQEEAQEEVQEEAREEVGKKVQEEAREPLDTVNRFRVEASFFLGLGIEKIKVGVTDDGDTISISGGGGLGGEITFGYGIYSMMEIDLTAGIYHSGLEPSVENADGSFNRGPFLATLKFNIPVTDSGQIKLGGGGGYYISGDLDVDTSQAPGGAHETIAYDNAFGYHITGEYEYFFFNNPSIIFGLKYYNVTYDAESYTMNGVSIPVDLLADKVRELNGSGVDFFFALAWYI